LLNQVERKEAGKGEMGFLKEMGRRRGQKEPRKEEQCYLKWAQKRKGEESAQEAQGEEKEG